MSHYRLCTGSLGEHLVQLVIACACMRVPPRVTIQLLHILAQAPQVPHLFPALVQGPVNACLLHPL